MSHRQYEHIRLTCFQWKQHLSRLESCRLLSDNKHIKLASEIILLMTYDLWVLQGHCSQLQIEAHIKQWKFIFWIVHRTNSQTPSLKQNGVKRLSLRNITCRFFNKILHWTLKSSYNFPRKEKKNWNTRNSKWWILSSAWVNDIQTMSCVCAYVCFKYLVLFNHNDFQQDNLICHLILTNEACARGLQWNHKNDQKFSPTPTLNASLHLIETKTVQKFYKIYNDRNRVI